MAQFLCQSYLGPQLCHTTEAWLVQLSSCVSHILDHSYAAPPRPGWCSSVPVSVIPWTTATPHHRGLVLGSEGPKGATCTSGFGSFWNLYDLYGL